MKNFIFAILCLLGAAANAQVPQPTNGNFNCEITGAPAGANDGACESTFVVNMVIDNELGCQGIESDRYWVANTAHGATAKDLRTFWSIAAQIGVTCTGPQSGVTTLGYTTDTLTCPGGSSEIDNPYDGSVRCHCPLQTVTGIGVVPGIFEGYPTPSCVPDMIYVNPFIQPNAPQ
jgi:hypothetical protein